MPNFAGYSNYSIAFGGQDPYAYFKAALTADDAILLKGLSADSLLRHAETLWLVTTMIRRSAGLDPLGNDKVSPLFSIKNILSGNLPSWKKNAYDQYEAVINCRMIPGTGPNPWQADYEPLQFTYINTRRHTQHVFAT
jgi:hypothetical protein